ncbi:cupin domain-containing protein [Aliiroseovarius sp. YM-037]|uniref:cupin domain-containing protein n=1 Tax=Aliiroseovarius sp. YM-037 TaxID=3341728 RepID=UPI003A80352C
MSLPDFILNFPEIDIPFPADVVTTNVVKSDSGLVVFFTFHKDMDLPPHSHLGQWGTIVAGSAQLTIGDDTQTYRPGDCYNIPAGVVHSGKIAAGTVAIDVFEEPDRYPLKS